MFKKFSGKSFISGIIIGSIMFSGITYAATAIKLKVDGVEINADVQPQEINGRVMVPARFLAEALGAKVEWDEANNTVVVLSKEKYLNNQAANALVKDALKAYWYVMSGGQQVDGAQVVTVTMNGIEYRYLGEDINTTEKLKSYLGKFYTEVIVAAIIKDGGIVEKDGKLVQPNADGGSLLHPGDTAEEIKYSEAEAQFEFKFEVGETGDHVPVHIAFKNNAGSGWRVDTSPKSIYQSGNQIN